MKRHGFVQPAKFGVHSRANGQACALIKLAALAVCDLFRVAAGDAIFCAHTVFWAFLRAACDFSRGIAIAAFRAFNWLPAFYRAVSIAYTVFWARDFLRRLKRARDHNAFLIALAGDWTGARLTTDNDCFIAFVFALAVYGTCGRWRDLTLYGIPFLIAYAVFWA